MNDLDNQGDAWTPPRTWLFKQVNSIVTKQSALTVDGWDEGGFRASSSKFAARRAELRTRHAAAEVIAALVTIAVRGLPPDVTDHRVTVHSRRTNGIEVRRGPAIIAAIIAGYTPLRDKSDSGCTFRRRVSS
jgi:hypothetical protein